MTVDSQPTSPQSTRVSRRGVLRGFTGVGAAAAMGGVCPFTGAAPANAATVALSTPGRAAGHAAFQRGLDVAVKVGRSTEGRYGQAAPPIPAGLSHLPTPSRRVSASTP